MKKDIESYNNFVQQKTRNIEKSGIEIETFNNQMFQFQKDIIKAALRKGKFAIWEGCGLGKTIQELEWSYHVNKHTNKPVLIFAPLAVSRQTEKEAKKFGYEIKLCKSQSDVINGINITNYEKINNFDPKEFSGVVLDESSILKSMTGKTRTELIELFWETPFKLAASATPSPNDFMELGSHAEFLNVMTYQQMLASFFINDASNTGTWRLKGHAQDEFWRWVSTWAVYVENPNDFGYNICGYDLPKLNIIDSVVDPKYLGQIAKGMNEARKARRETIQQRCEYAANIINNSNEQWIVWCDLNDESKLLHSLIPDSVEISGASSENEREDYTIGFQEEKYRVIVTKPQIAGFGINWQQSFNQAFVGIGYSYEQFYQAVRRQWRFGQKNDVNVHIITTKREGDVYEKLLIKEKKSQEMIEQMKNHFGKHFNETISGENLFDDIFEHNKEFILPLFMK